MTSLHSDILWIEKYRPKTIEDIVHQDHVKKMLKNVVKSGNMPHCLFYGLPGTGKTSAALALCSELFRNQNIKHRVLELNASHERGISVIREKIKSWARILVGSTSSFVENGVSSVDWKIIILDEADMMTPDAQSALRRIMEDNVKTTRFIIICNYVSRIIDPIASRCARFRFNAIERSSQQNRLHCIASAEEFCIEPKAVDRICDISEGDLRMAVMLLQSASTLVDKKGTITLDNVERVAGVPPPEVAEELIQCCLTPHSSASVIAIHKETMASGWDISQLLRQLTFAIVHRSDLSDATKAAIIQTQATAHFRVMQGACESLQLLDVLMATFRQLQMARSAKHKSA